MIVADGLGAALYGIGVVFQLLWVLWILAIIELVRIPEGQFRAVGTQKTSWVVVVAVLQFLGALIWFVTKRSAVKAATPLAPAAWYPDPEPGAAGLRWWDGTAGTEHRTPPAPPA